MTLTKKDIVDSVRENVRFRRPQKTRQKFLFPEMNYLPLSRRRSLEIVDSLMEIIKETLATGEDVLISGFGKFQVKFKWPRRGRNPRTGEMIILNSNRTVNFRPSKKLRTKMNRTAHDDIPGPHGKPH